MTARFSPEQLEHAAHNLCAKTQNKDGWPIHAIAAWEHEQRRGDRLYQALCDMEAERDAAVRKAAADARTLAALRENLRDYRGFILELDRLMARPDGPNNDIHSVQRAT